MTCPGIEVYSTCIFVFLVFLTGSVRANSVDAADVDATGVDATGVRAKCPDRERNRWSWEGPYHSATSQAFTGIFAMSRRVFGEAFYSPPPYALGASSYFSFRCFLGRIYSRRSRASPEYD